MNRNAKPLPPHHCLLSEFDLPGLRWLGLARSEKAVSWLAFACFLWAAMTLWLGDRLQANAMGLSFEATVTPAGGRAITGTTKLVYGWMAQVNEGPFYLLVGPLLLIMAQRFLLAGGVALQQLSEAGRLRVIGGKGGAWAAEMARRNRWCGLPLLLLPLFVYVCLQTQLPSIDRTAQGYPTTRAKYGLPGLGEKTNWQEIGYIQSLNFPLWTRAFATRDAKTKAAALEQVGCMKPLAAALFAELERLNELGDASLKPFLNFRAGKAESLQLKEAIIAGVVSVKAEALWPTISPVPWLGGGAFFAEVLRGRSMDTFEVKRVQYVAWFKLFIVLSQLQIAAFFVFMTWLLLKIVFWLAQVYRLLPSSKGPPVPSKVGRKREIEIVFDPVVSDPGGRYGLGALFRPYDLLVLVVAIGSSFMALHFPDGEGIRAITEAEGAGMGATRVVHVFAIAAAISAVLIGPLWLYPRRLRRWAETHRLRDLRKDLAGTSTAASRKELLEEESAILDQSTWPRGDSRFRFTIVIVFAVLLLPVGTAFEFLPGQITPLTRLPQVLRAACKDLATTIYKVGQPDEK